MIDDILGSKDDNKDIFVYPDGSIYAPWGYGCLFEQTSDDFLEDNEEK